MTIKVTRCPFYVSLNEIEISHVDKNRNVPGDYFHMICFYVIYLSCYLGNVICNFLISVTLVWFTYTFNVIVIAFSYSLVASKYIVLKTKSFSRCMRVSSFNPSLCDTSFPCPVHSIDGWNEDLVLKPKLK